MNQTPLSIPPVKKESEPVVIQPSITDGEARLIAALAIRAALAQLDTQPRWPADAHIGDVRGN